MQPEQRNILRLIFCNLGIGAAQDDWNDTARFVVAAFRADVARAGATAEVAALVDELCVRSAEFAALWRDNEVRVYGGGTKRLRHPAAGLIELEYSGFVVEGRPDLGLIVYQPVSTTDADRIRSLVEA